MPDLVATAWTSAGDTSPMRVPATSPVPIAKRVAAVADAGFCGLGLIADDLAIVRDTIGFVGLRDLLADHELTHIEIELIERWWIPRGEPGHTYDVRDLLFEAADVLSPAFVKIGSQNGPAIDDPLTLVDPLRELADEAVEHGTRVAIEPMPFSAIATVPMGVEIVDAAAHPAAGLVIDAWHVFRAGTPLTELSTASRHSTSSASNSMTPPNRSSAHCSKTLSSADSSAARGLSIFAAWSPSCATQGSTDRGAWRSCRLRSGSCQSARRSSWPQTPR